MLPAGKAKSLPDDDSKAATEISMGKRVTRSVPELGEEVFAVMLTMMILYSFA